jgi:hypothetical protein
MLITARLGGEGVNLSGTSSDIAEEAFNRIRTANMTMHCQWKGIKSQEMLFVLAQAP